jgi:hypothetical protein
MQRFVLALCLFLGALVAQRAEIVNHSAHAVDAWQRVTVDTPLPHPAGRVGDVRYVLAHPIGLDAYAVDVRLPLASGERRVVDFSAATAEPFALGPLPADPVAFFGGELTLGGARTLMVGATPQGAAWRVELLTRFGETFCARVWLTWCPDHPATATGELVLVSSNPQSPLLEESAPVDVRLAFGDALVWSVGRGFGGMVLPAGESLADGQGRFVPFAMCWPRHMRAQDWGNALSLAWSPTNLGVCGVGIDRLILEGKPRMPAGFNVANWIGRHWPRVLAELHTWDTSELGASKRSGNSGGQEVQTYHVGGEALVSGGVGAERVRFLNAMRLHTARPMNHLRADGEGVLGSPGLLFTYGAPHYHPGVNQDARSKPREPGTGYLIKPNEIQTHGFAGPDEQHHYMGDVAAVARLVASPAAQWSLERHATVYLLQRTDVPGWSTSATWSAREWGCEADLVLHLWRNLNNRALAEQVVARWRSRVTRILVPTMANREWIMVWYNDTRVNATGAGMQAWQESFASAAVWRTCATVGPSAGMDVAVRIARKVLATSWHAEGDAWRAQAQGPLDGSSNAANPAGMGMNGYGMPCAVWLMRKVEPGNVKANAVWNYLLATNAGEFRWMLP